MSYSIEVLASSVGKSELLAKMESLGISPQPELSALLKELEAIAADDAKIKDKQKPSESEPEKVKKPTPKFEYNKDPFELKSNPETEGSPRLKDSAKIHNPSQQMLDFDSVENLFEYNKDPFELTQNSPAPSPDLQTSVYTGAEKNTNQLGLDFVAKKNKKPNFSRSETVAKNATRFRKEQEVQSIANLQKEIDAPRFQVKTATEEQLNAFEQKHPQHPKVKELQERALNKAFKSYQAGLNLDNPEQNINALESIKSRYAGIGEGTSTYGQVLSELEGHQKAVQALHRNKIPDISEFLTQITGYNTSKEETEGILSKLLPGKNTMPGGKVSITLPGHIDVNSLLKPLGFSEMRSKVPWNRDGTTKTYAVGLTQDSLKLSVDDFKSQLDIAHEPKTLANTLYNKFSTNMTDKVADLILSKDPNHSEALLYKEQQAREEEARVQEANGQIMADESEKKWEEQERLREAEDARIKAEEVEKLRLEQQAAEAKRLADEKAQQELLGQQMVDDWDNAFNAKQAASVAAQNAPPATPVINPRPQPAPGAPRPANPSLPHKLQMASFDTETTGIDHKNSGIWQFGIAKKRVGGNFQHSSDEHAYPFLDNNPHHPIVRPVTAQSFEDSMKNINGAFSLKAHNTNQFDQLYKEFGEELATGIAMQTRQEALEKTFGAIRPGTALIMQNHNFENQQILAMFERGEISAAKYSEYQTKMLNVNINAAKGIATNEIFQRPGEVIEATRLAERAFIERFMPTRDAGSFSEYVTHMNTAFDAYGNAIHALHGNTAAKIPVVELMDISKIFLANLAEKGLIEKENSRLGINVDFLTRAFYQRSEKHTAVSDSKDTLELFEDMWKYTNELRSGAPASQALLEVVGRIKGQTNDEVNRLFLNSLKSKTSDFLIEGKSRVKLDQASVYQKRETVLNTETGSVTELHDYSSGVMSRESTNIGDVFMSDVDRFAVTYVEDINGFNRSAFAVDALNKHTASDGSVDYQGLHTYLEEFKETELATTYAFDGKKPPTKIIAEVGGVLETSYNKGSKWGIALTAGVGLLGVMALTTRPEEKDPNADLPVYEKFYDEQYLGSGFVDFDERNKRYVY